MNEHPNAAIIRSVYEAMEKQMCPPSRRSSTTALPDPSLAGFEGDYHGRDPVRHFSARSSRKPEWR